MPLQIKLLKVLGYGKIFDSFYNSFQSEVVSLEIGHASVTSFSSQTSESRGLKFGMHNPHMDGSKVVDQIFGILLRG